MRARCSQERAACGRSGPPQRNAAPNSLLRAPLAPHEPPQRHSPRTDTTRIHPHALLPPSHITHRVRAQPSRAHRERARASRVRAPPVLVPNYVPTWRNICSPFGSIARNKRSPFCSHLCSKSGNIFSIRRNKLWTISSRDWNKMFLSAEHKRERIVSSVPLCSYFCSLICS